MTDKYTDEVYFFDEHPLKWIFEWVGETESALKEISRLLVVIFTGMILFFLVITIPAIVANYVPYGWFIYWAVALFVAYKWIRWSVKREPPKEEDG